MSCQRKSVCVLTYRRDGDHHRPRGRCVKGIGNGENMKLRLRQSVDKRVKKKYVIFLYKGSMLGAMDSRRLLLAAAVTLGASAAEVECQDKTPTALIKQLGSSDWKKRERAMAELRESYDDRLEAELLNVRGGDYEMQNRIQVLLAPWHQKQVKVRVDSMKAACNGKVPWIDMLPEESCDRWAIQSHYMNDIPAGPKDAYPDYQKYEKATERMLFDLSAQKFDFSPMIERMKVRQNDWLQSRKLPPQYNVK